MTTGLKLFLAFIFLLVLGVAGFAGWFFRADRGMPAMTDTKEGGANAWQTFTNEQYGFSISYPPDWIVADFSDDPVAPRFNLYPKDAENPPPYTHHDAMPNVSVFPRGVPTEGIFGAVATSTVAFGQPASSELDFILDDGTAWATAATFEDAPIPWEAWGFIWARSSTDGVTAECVRDGAAIPDSQCEVFTDTIVRRGSVPAEERATEVRMLESFKFLDTAPAARDLIRVDTPKENDIVKSPLRVTGEAKGFWYFEASFPVRLVDQRGNLIARGIAQAQSDWMVTDFVPFVANLTFIAEPKTPEGTLILQRDNPSGLPEYDASLEISVRFEK